MMQALVPIGLLIKHYPNIYIVLFCIVFFSIVLITSFLTFTKPWLQISGNTIILSPALFRRMSIIDINKLEYVQTIKQKQLIGETTRFLFYMKNHEIIGFKPTQEKKIMKAILDVLAPYMDKTS
ncbi:hypothetical protein [Candidatus Albibeggiatoa sp. nov. BB20]|uniref:hypothetical protein n=1 Tax=Candidatus Albibeggiatoa sp. nov. BB20 TaxID=3162723 RepID=UPI0033654D8B